MLLPALISLDLHIYKAPWPINVSDQQKRAQGLARQVSILSLAAFEHKRSIWNQANLGGLKGEGRERLTQLLQFANLDEDHAYAQSPLALMGSLAWTVGESLRLANIMFSDWSVGAVLHLYHALRRYGHGKPIPIFDLILRQVGNQLQLKEFERSGPKKAFLYYQSGKFTTKSHHLARSEVPDGSGHKLKQVPGFILPEKPEIHEFFPECTTWLPDTMDQDIPYEAVDLAQLYVNILDLGAVMYPKVMTYLKKTELVSETATAVPIHHVLGVMFNEFEYYQKELKSGKEISPKWLHINIALSAFNESDFEEPREYMWKGV